MQERRPIVTPLSHVPIIWPAIFADDCTGTYGYVTSGTGPDYSGSYVTTTPFVGTKCLRLTTRATGPTSGDYVSAYKMLWLPTSYLLRLRIAAKRHAASPDTTANFILYWWDGITAHIASISFQSTDEKVYYQHDWAGNTTDTGLVFRADPNAWNYLDLSINLRNLTFHTLIVNHQTLDMSSISLPSDTSIATPRAALYLSLFTAANAQAIHYYDQILLTAENP